MRISCFSTWSFTRQRLRFNFSYIFREKQFIRYFSFIGDVTGVLGFDQLLPSEGNIMSLIPLFVARRAVRATSLVHQTSRSMAGYWNKDWRPADDVPKTEDERRAAAKKYGLIPEDYETYPDDGTGYGDYPKLPMIGAESRDPHALYDIPELKRNFGEPMQVHSDLLGEDRWNYNQRLRIPISQMLLTYVGVMSALAVMFFIGEHVRFHPTRMMPKSLVTDGQKHYSFELE